eukprot:387012-Prymnesium_polylepis.1
MKARRAWPWRRRARTKRKSQIRDRAHPHAQTTMYTNIVWGLALRPLGAVRKTRHDKRSTR